MAASPSGDGVGPTELEQAGVQAILQGDRETMACPVVESACDSLDQLCGGECRRGIRYDLIVIAVDDERRDVDLLQVLCEVGLGEDLDAVVRVLGARLHTEEPECVPD